MGRFKASNEQILPYVEASPQLCVRGKKDLAADTFLPLLNQLISRSCCQEGVRLGGLGEGVQQIWEW